MAVPSTPAEPPKSADSVRLSVTGEVQFIAVVRVASRMRRAAPPVADRWGRLHTLVASAAAELDECGLSPIRRTAMETGDNR
jgi:hypothetical protein